MKKKFWLSSAAILASLTLVACGGGNTSESSSTSEASSATDDKVTLKFAALESGYGAEMWPEIIEAYQKANPNVTVELNQNKEIEDVLSPQMKAGDFPDVVMVSVGRQKALPETLLKEKAIADISDVFTKKVYGEDVTVKDKILNGVVGSTITDPYADGKQYMAPMFYAPTGMFYNKTLLKDKGWEVPKNMDEMKALGEKAKAEGIALFTFPGSGYFDSFLPVLLANSGGPQLFTDAMSYKEGVYVSADATKAFTAMGDILAYVEPTTVANGTPQNYMKNQQLVLDNKAIFMPNGTWVVGEMADAPRAEGFEWGVAAPPAVTTGGDQYAYSFIEQLWVPEGAENKDAAKEFITYLYSDEAAKLFAKHSAAQPIKDVVNMLDAEQKALYEFTNTATGIINGGFKATKPVEGVSIKEVMYDTIDSVATGEKTVEEWQKAIEEVSAKFRAALE